MTGIAYGLARGEIDAQVPKDLQDRIGDNCYTDVVRNLTNDSALSLIQDILIFERTNKSSAIIEDLIQRATCVSQAEKLEAKFR